MTINTDIETKTNIERLLAQLGVRSIEEALRAFRDLPLPRSIGLPVARGPPGLDTYVTFTDLKAAGIVPNWTTLRAWQKDPEINFPPGRLFGPNSRRWALAEEILPWLASRPVERMEARAVA